MFPSLQDYLGAMIVLTAAGASIWTSHSGLDVSLVGLGLTYALTVSCPSFYLSFRADHQLSAFPLNIPFFILNFQSALFLVLGHQLPELGGEEPG